MIKANNIGKYREEIISMALLQYGKRYIHGMMGPDSFDCAGLAWYIYKYVYNINIFFEGYGRSTTTMLMTSKYGTIKLFNSSYKDIFLIKEGDILLFHRQSLSDNFPTINNKYPGHCGIYLGNNKFIHATKREGKVIISSFDNDYWKDKLVASKDIVSDEKVFNIIR